VRIVACALLLGLGLAGCECDPAERPRERARSGAPEQGTAGGDATEDSSHGPAIALREWGPDVPAPARFEPIEPEAARTATRARGWSSIADLRSGATARLSLGNWLCRIWTHYGAPTAVQSDGFVYAFRDRETGDVISAYSAGSGPAMGGIVIGEDGLPIEGAQQRVSASVDAFVALMDATEPGACELELPGDHGAIRVGVRAGEWFEESIE